MVKAAGLLGRGYSISQTATVAEVGTTTVKRWKHDPEFMAEVERVRALSANPTSDGALLDALTALTPSGSPDHPTRVRAAIARLQFGLEEHAAEDDEMVSSLPPTR
jgi:hypothetical protein